jgi:PAS domain S-box-containing protein
MGPSVLASRIRLSALLLALLWTLALTATVLLQSAFALIAVWSGVFVITLLGASQLAGAARDLEESHAEALQARQRLEFALQGTDVGVWDWNVRTGELSLDARWAEMVGENLRDLQPHADTWFSRIHPDDLPEAQMIVREHLEGRSDLYELRHRIRHRDGSWRWILARGMVVARDRAGNPLRMVGTHLDWTDHERRDQESRELERRSLEARRLESLGILAGGIAHDFNNQLQVIRGNAELARETVGDGSEAAPFLDTAIAAIDRSVDASEKLLLYAGRSAETFIRVDLRALAAARVDHADAGGQVAMADPAGEPVWVAGEVRQLEQLVDNLVSNGLEALEGRAQGRVVVAVGIAELDAHAIGTELGLTRLRPGRQACLIVSDEGEGMDGDNLERITDPFYSTRFAGRGLGMAVVHGVLRNHAGGMRIESSRESGTRVAIYLPLIGSS